MAKIIQDKTLTDIADAIRTKTNTTDKMTPISMPDKIKGISGGIEPSGRFILTHNHLNYDVRKYAQAYADIPEATYFTKLMDNTLEDFEYYGTEYKATVFTNHTGLKTVKAPYIWNLPGNAFYCCYSLRKAFLPSVSRMAINTLYSCNSLIEFINPTPCYFDTGQHFTGCTILRKVDIYPTFGSMFLNEFQDCKNLKTLIMRGTTIPMAFSTSLFDNSPIAIPDDGTEVAEEDKGYIYVQQDMIESYKSASNWADFAERFRAIEDYPDICAYPDEYLPYVPTT